jgi:hypothetical protein
MSDDLAAKAAPKAAKGRARGRPFPKGVSGNPAGMKPGTKHRTPQIAEALIDGQAEKIIQKIISLALKGDTALLRWLGDRIAPVRKDRHIELHLGSVVIAQDALAASRIVLQAVAAGQLTPSEGEMLSKALSVHIGLHGAVEVESQLSALEQTHGVGRLPS